MTETAVAEAAKLYDDLVAKHGREEANRLWTAATNEFDRIHEGDA